MHSCARRLTRLVFTFFLGKWSRSFTLPKPFLFVLRKLLHFNASYFFAVRTEFLWSTERQYFYGGYLHFKTSEVVENVALDKDSTEIFERTHIVFSKKLIVYDMTNNAVKK